MYKRYAAISPCFHLGTHFHSLCLQATSCTRGRCNAPQAIRRDLTRREGCALRGRDATCHVCSLRRVVLTRSITVRSTGRCRFEASERDKSARSTEHRPRCRRLHARLSSKRFIYATFHFSALEGCRKPFPRCNPRALLCLLEHVPFAPLAAECRP